MAYNNNGNQQQSSLESIFSYSWPANHLLQISLVRQASESANNKKQHFVFVTLAPGIKNPDGSRSFDFQQNKITMKIDLDKLLAFAEGIPYYVQGREAMIGPLTAFVDSSKSSSTKSR